MLFGVVVSSSAISAARSAMKYGARSRGCCDATGR